MHDQFDGFSIYLAEDEEGDFLAHFIELPNVSAFANSPEDAQAGLSLNALVSQKLATSLRH